MPGPTEPQRGAPVSSGGRRRKERAASSSQSLYWGSHREDKAGQGKQFRIGLSENPSGPCCIGPVPSCLVPDPR